MNQKQSIKKVQNHLKEVFPHASKITIKTSRTKNEGLRSVIKVVAPGKRQFVAVKTDLNPHLSLEKAKQAIIRQIHKIKSQWKKDRSLLQRERFTIPQLS